MKEILGVLGGLALFLYGMKMMSEGLESAAGSRLESILETMTNHKLKAVLVGTIITCIIQSSSAMSVMLIGFVNAKVMKLENAIWVIMGANIGTTITGQMMALNIGALAPVFAIIGVILIVFFNRLLFQQIGMIIAGFGILFMGLEIMSICLSPLQDASFFIQLMSSLKHPIYAVLFGTLFTAIIQSSSASLGILQILSMQGLIPFEVGACMIYGFNIGTCMTAYLASLTGCDNAKRLTCFHILLNVAGAIVFVIMSYFLPILKWIQLLSPQSIMLQLANLHTVFNVISTLIVLPIDRYFIRIVYKCIPEK